MTQLAFQVEPAVPGVYSVWAETPNRHCGTGWSAFYRSADEARAAAVARLRRHVPGCEVGRVEARLKEYGPRPRPRDWSGS